MPDLLLPLNFLFMSLSRRGGGALTIRRPGDLPIFITSPSCLRGAAMCQRFLLRPGQSVAVATPLMLQADRVSPHQAHIVATHVAPDPLRSETGSKTTQGQTMLPPRRPGPGHVPAPNTRTAVEADETWEQLDGIPSRTLVYSNGDRRSRARGGGGARGTRRLASRGTFVSDLARLRQYTAPQSPSRMSAGPPW